MAVQRYRANWGPTQGVNAALVQNLTRLATQIGTNIGANFRDAFMVAGKAWADSIRQGKQMQFQADMAEAEQIERLGANIGRGLENYARMRYQKEQGEVVAGQREEQLAETARHHEATEQYYEGSLEERRQERKRRGRKDMMDLLGRTGRGIKDVYGKALDYDIKKQRADAYGRGVDSLVEARKRTGGRKPVSLVSQISIVEKQLKQIDNEIMDIEGATAGVLADETYTEWSQADAAEHARKQDSWWKRGRPEPYTGTEKEGVSPQRRKRYDELTSQRRKLDAKLQQLRRFAVPDETVPTLAPAMQDNALIPVDEREAELIAAAKARGMDEGTIRAMLFDLRSGNFPPTN